MIPSESLRRGFWVRKAPKPKPPTKINVRVASFFAVLDCRGPCFCARHLADRKVWS